MLGNTLDLSYYKYIPKCKIVELIKTVKILKNENNNLYK